MADKIKCSECEYCGKYYGSHGIFARGRFFCDHPDQKYINKFFKDNRLSSTPGFICYGIVRSDDMSLKTSPRWCPKKKGSM